MDLPVRVQRELLVCYDVGNLDRISGRRAAAILNVSLPTLRTLLKNRETIDARSERFPFAAATKAQPRGHRAATFDGYGAEDVYGLVETGLYDEAPGPATAGRGPLCTVLFVTNLTGTDKKRPVVRAAAAAGRTLVDDAGSLRRGRWAAGDYATFLREWDGQLQAARRAVLLILDNRSARPAVPLRNIEIRRLPESCTVHPLGLCIARVARTRESYERASEPRRTDRRGAVRGRCGDGNCDVATVSVYLDALADAWDAAVTPAVIRNCFRAIGLLKTGAEDDRVASDSGRRADRQRRRQRRPSAYRDFGNTVRGAESAFQNANLQQY